MSDNFLESFLVTLGFKVDGSSERKFNESLFKATLQAKLLGDALEATARKVVDSISSMARGFEQLYYESQRTRTSAADLKAFAFAMGQAGSSAEDANSAVEGFARALRENRGNFAFLTTAGIAVKDATGNFRPALDLMKDYMGYLDKFPVDTAEAFLSNFHVPESVFLAYRQHRAEIQKWEAEDKRKNGILGINPDKVASDAKSLMNSLRDLGQTVAKIGEKFESQFFATFKTQLDSLNTFLLDNGKTIAKTLEAIASVIIQVVDALKKWLANPDSQNQIKQWATSIDDFATHLKNANIVQTLDKWLDRFDRLYKFLGFLKSFEFSGGIFDGRNNGAGWVHDKLFGPDGKPTEAPKDERNWWQRTMPSWLGGKEGPAGARGAALSDAARRGGGRGGSASAASRQFMMTAAMDQLRKEGVPKDHLRAAAAHLVGQADMESGLDPNKSHDGGTGYGIYGARLERRNKMLNWLAENGYARNSPEGQMRYMAHEAMNDPTYRPTRNVLMSGAGPEATTTITRNFEAPKIINYRAGAVRQAFAAGPLERHASALDKLAAGAAKIGDAVVGHAQAAVGPKSPFGSLAAASQAHFGGRSLPLLATEPLGGGIHNTWHQPTNTTTISPSTVVNITGQGTADDFARAFERSGRRFNADIIRNAQGAAQ